MDDLRVERILRAVECVPRGRAATYGLIGKVVGEVPRVIGWTMHAWGSEQRWWRIVNAAGTIPGHTARALPHWRDEGLLAASASGVPGADVDPGAARVDLPRVLLAQETLERAWREAAADLPGLDEIPGGSRR
ncbi:MGMT family protein [Rothia kristinae]|uniref:MGMT family protein n=1 Tax=Rothia kristinae TaxID=37923 RepID=A0A7T4MUR9_9MICC|nr:MGMT family protein [Rothia kristinae]QQC59968.1 MGMT family protein [Rothia kristinae]